MVTMLPSFISALITSAAFTDILCASSATVMVSGTSTSRTIGSVGATKVVSSLPDLDLPLRPRQPASGAAPPRVLSPPLRFAASSFQLPAAFLSGPLAPLAAPGLSGLCSVLAVGATGAAGAAGAAAFWAASSLAVSRAASACLRKASRSVRALASEAWRSCRAE